MPLFTYRAKSVVGEDIKGVVEAKDKKTAAVMIQKKNVYIVAINQTQQSIIKDVTKRLFRKVGFSELVTFTRQMATMINAGMPLTESILLLKNQSTQQFREILGLVLREVEGGISMADALANFPSVFTPVYIALVRAGEAAGVLDTVFNRLADNLETQREFRAKLKGALIYPIIITIGMVLVMVVMMVVVVPKLTSLYKEFDAKLPQITEILISISNLAVKAWWTLPIVCLGGYYLFTLIYKTPFGRRKIDEIKFMLPIFGPLQKKVVLAELSRTIGLLVGSGVSLVEALTISSKVTNNQIVEEAILQVNKLVEKGYPLASAMSQQPVFPPIFSQMVSVGEETGKIDEILLKVSKYYQSESEESLKGLTSALEPLIMVVLGIGVGFLIIAIILPIYNLTNEIK